MTETESAILAHARRCAPAESCGFVVRTPEGERYIPCVNISAEPEAYFRIAPEDWLRAEMQGEIVALVHSHPGGLNRPGFPGECFICELRLPDHRFRWKHNKLFLLLPEEYGPAFPAIVDCYTSPPT